MINPQAVHPERTAIWRHKLSHPVQLAIASSILTPERTFLDYGCGHGEDVARLQAAGYKAFGYDPYYFPSNPLVEADVVNLGYVLNVIPDITDRDRTLKMAFQLASHTLIVAACVHCPDSGMPYADGEITQRGTFQHHFTHAALEQFIAQDLGTTPLHIEDVFFASKV